jgi:hypothetical protein
MADERPTDRDESLLNEFYLRPALIRSFATPNRISDCCETGCARAKDDKRRFHLIGLPHASVSRYQIETMVSFRGRNEHRAGGSGVRGTDVLVTNTCN